VILGLLLLGACTSNVAGGASVTVTAPQGLGQLVPTRTLAIGWTVAGGFDAAHTRVTLIDREGTASHTIVDQGVVGAGGTTPTATGFTWAGLDSAGAPVPAGFYSLSVDVGAGPVSGGDDHVVVVQGVVFTSPAPMSAAIGVSKAAPASLELATATASSLMVQLYARPQAGPSTVFKALPVPGEVRTIARTVTWDGSDDHGDPLPPGMYTLGATVTDATAAATYTVAGGDVILK